MRQCGTCTACCRVKWIPETNSPRGEWCKECTPGVGCGIYPTRPKPCADYQCAWLRGFGTEDDRPDRSRFVVDSLHLTDDLSVVRFWAAIEHPTERQFRRSLERVGGPLIDQLQADGRRVVKEIQLLGKRPRDAMAPRDLTETQRNALRAYVDSGD